MKKLALALLALSFATPASAEALLVISDPSGKHVQYRSVRSMKACERQRAELQKANTANVVLCIDKSQK